MVGTRAGFALALLTVATVLGFVLAESHGILPPSQPVAPAMRWIVQSFVFLFSAVVIAYFVRAYRSRLQEADKLGRDLAQRTGEVQAREADLNRAQAVAHVGSWVYELAAGAMYLSTETCRIFGLPEGTQRSRESYLSGFIRRTAEPVDSAWQVALTGGATFDNEHRIWSERRSAGSGKRRNWSSVPMAVPVARRGRDHGHHRAQACGRGAARARGALPRGGQLGQRRRSHGRQRGQYCGWNRSAERIFGYAEAEVIGQPLTIADAAAISERASGEHGTGCYPRRAPGHRQARRTGGRRKDAKRVPAGAFAGAVDHARRGLVFQPVLSVTSLSARRPRRKN